MVKNKAQFRIKRVYNFLANASIYFENQGNPLEIFTFLEKKYSENIIYSSGAQKRNRFKLCSVLEYE